METMNFTGTEQISISRQAVVDLVELKDKFDLIVESLELMSDREFMDSYRESKEQIKKREFDDFS